MSSSQIPVSGLETLKASLPLMSINEDDRKTLAQQIETRDPMLIMSLRILQSNLKDPNAIELLNSVILSITNELGLFIDSPEKLQNILDTKIYPNIKTPSKRDHLKQTIDAFLNLPDDADVGDLPHIEIFTLVFRDEFDKAAIPYVNEVMQYFKAHVSTDEDDEEESVVGKS